MKQLRLCMITLLSALAFVSSVSAQTVPEGTPLDTLNIGQWVKIDLERELVCSDGAPYDIFVQRGESNNLMIYFAGGGAAWDAETASQPLTMVTPNGFYMPRVLDILPRVTSGILNAGAEENLFHDWTKVYLPYCTADLHIGNTDQTYTTDDGDTVTMHHRGQVNVTGSLDWIYAQFPSPDGLVVAGESAGAWGSLMWVPSIAEHYPDLQVFHLADGSFLSSDQWPEIVDESWGADFEATFGFAPGTDLITSAYLDYAQNAPSNITFLHVNTLYDAVIIFFNSALNDVPDDNEQAELWSAGMRAMTAEVAASGLDYQYFLTDATFDPLTGRTSHTAISIDALFFELEEDGVTLAEWVTRVIVDGERFSVGAEFLP